MTAATKRCPRRRQKRRVGRLWLCCLLVAAVVTASAVGLPHARAALRLRALHIAQIPTWIDEAYIPVGGARQGVPLSAFDGVVIHYVGNPGTTAMNNRNYFAQETTEVVSHFVVGLDGEIVQCLPLAERSVASNSRNRDTISVEVCHPDESGAFTPATYAALVKLTAWLCDLGGLEETAVIRHYDITGKECPRYYVRHPQAWESFRQDVRLAREKA